MDTMMIVGWAIAFVFFIVVEIATASALVSIWLAFGALIAMFFAIADFGFIVQLTVFVIASVILLIATRPLVRKMQGEKYHTNFELDIGKSAVVTERINNELGEGRVKLGGTNWAARSSDGSVIDEGAVVTVQEVDGAKLIVSK
ncbi:NfeD family protein [Ruminococcus sp. Marseille-P6503]|uniref:NfeD family protein n=1 Tax=Ruminococcus sp. Marseille-P6503 TaxID=2364796 RepID=UPI000F539EB2|nr:NfeD family protein [Ruminococcus sp. Marseille-P6503]